MMRQEPVADWVEGKYEILGKIREGGMGAVYKVRHRLLHEIRVIKIIRPQLEAGPELNERFLREARLAIQLRHPNIAQLHDFSIDDDGRAFIVMEYIEGVTLEDILKAAGPPSIGLALEIARQTLKGLGSMHRKGMVHRDVSPDNVMLSRNEDGEPRIALIDLGIAKALAGGSHLTTTGAFLGKPKYAAPEQFGVAGQDAVDTRSDLYSFGVVFYELLTGTSPIQGRDPSSLIAGHLFRPPVDFSESDPGRRVPADLRAVVLRMLAKEPVQRFQTAEQIDRLLTEIGRRYPNRSEGLEPLLQTAAAAPAPGAPPPGTTQDRLDREFTASVTPAEPAAGTLYLGEVPRPGTPAPVVAPVPIPITTPAPAEKPRLVVPPPPRLPRPEVALSTAEKIVSRVTPADRAGGPPGERVDRSRAVLSGSAAAAFPGAPRRPSRLPWIAVAVALAAGVAGGLWWSQRPPSRQPTGSQPPETPAPAVSVAAIPAPTPPPEPPAPVETSAPASVPEPSPAPPPASRVPRPTLKPAPESSPSKRAPNPASVKATQDSSFARYAGSLPSAAPEPSPSPTAAPTTSPAPTPAPPAVTAPMREWDSASFATSVPAPTTKSSPTPASPSVTAPTTMSDSIERARLVSVARPAFPKEAKGLGFTHVAVAVMVNEQGRVIETKVVSAYTLGRQPATKQKTAFVDAAVKAASQARFEPARRAGVPIKVPIELGFDFKPPGR
jgi:serine/threonine-protein kinase